MAAGQIGQPPVRSGQQHQITLSNLGRLVEPEQFENIIVRADRQGRVVRIKDVARVELGAKNPGRQLQGRRQAVGGVDHLPIARRQRAGRRRPHPRQNGRAGAELSRRAQYEIQYDTTPYTRECISEVFKSLRDAIMLVAFVVLLFLQNWRSAMIPLMAVPVAIIGTFAVMAAFGFSLNNLTLFGLVLAIGIVVDDAIVVVEAVEHHIEAGLSPRDATIKAMSQVSGAGGGGGAGPQRGVRALRVHQRHHRTVLPPVRADDRQLDDHFRLQLADAQPRPGGHPARGRATRKPTSRCRDWRSPCWPAGWATALLAPWLGSAGRSRTWRRCRMSMRARTHVGTAVDRRSRGPGPRLAARRSAERHPALGLPLVRPRRFTALPALYFRAVGRLLRLSALVLVVYAGLLGLTYWAFARRPRVSSRRRTWAT